MLRVGEQIGQYKIISELGRGGMATVYKAYHEKLDRHVAIKVMHQSFATEEGFIERFKREAQIVAHLDHPNIVPVYDYDEHNGMPYLVMKIIQGRSLKQIMLKRTPTLDEIIRIMTAIADATTYAHQKGILHRDIKPSNIVLDEENIPYLTDFGLARIVAAGESTMSADALLGTPNYMSPEQARGAKDIDYHSDLYSLGIVLYELVVGKVPFSAPTPLAVIHDHINTPLPQPSAINPEISTELEKVLKKALAKNPHDRYDSANQMLEAFTQAIKNDQLESLAGNRQSIADKSLTRWREAYIEQESALEKDPETSVAEKPIPRPSINSAYPTPIMTTVHNETHGRFWIMGGIGVFIFSLFMIITVILNASNTMLVIADTVQQMTANTELGEPDADNLRYNIPRLSVAEALSKTDSEPNNAINYLSLAQAYYAKNDLDLARTALNDGRVITTNTISYLATATTLANTANDQQLAVLYGILLWDQTASDTSLRGRTAFNTVSEFLYQQSKQGKEIQLSNDSRQQINEILGNSDEAQDIIQSQITRIIVTSSHIHANRERLATLTLRLWTDETHALPIGQMVAAEYDMLVGETDSALDQLNQLVQTSTTPQWIVTIATDLINQTKE